MKATVEEQVLIPLRELVGGIVLAKGYSRCSWVRVNKNSHPVNHQFEVLPELIGFCMAGFHGHSYRNFKRVGKWKNNDNNFFLGVFTGLRKPQQQNQTVRSVWGHHGNFVCPPTAHELNTVQHLNLDTGYVYFPRWGKCR